MSNSEHLNLFRSYLLGPNSESITVCFVRFLSLLGRFWNFLRVSINHLDQLGKPNQPVHLVQFAGTAVWVVWFVCVGSWLFGVGIELRLSCWIPDFVRKVLEFFEIFCQPYGPIGKTKPAGSFGSVCWNGSLGGLICLCWFLVFRSRN